MTTKWIEEPAWTQSAGTYGARRNQRECWETTCHEMASEDRPVELRRRRALKVLVVADVRARSHGLDQLVKDLGHDVSAVHPGSAALSLARARQPDVTMLDLDVPIPGWCQLARPLRDELTRSDCLIIAVTRQPDRKCRQQCRDVGIDLVLSMPVVPSVLETLLWMECARVNELLSDMRRVPMPDHSPGFQPSLY